MTGEALTDASLNKKATDLAFEGLQRPWTTDNKKPIKPALLGQLLVALFQLTKDPLMYVQLITNNYLVPLIESQVRAPMTPTLRIQVASLV